MPVHFDAETVQTFYVGPASCGVPGTAVGLERALERFGSAPLAELVGPGCAAGPRGGAGQRRAGLHPRHPRADPRTAAGDAGALRARREAAAGGGRVPLRRARRGAGTVRRRRGGAVLPRRGGGGAERLRRRQRRQPRARRPRRLRGDRAQADPRPVPRRRGADQPAALLGRDPDRLLAGPARAPWRAQRPGAAGRRDGGRQRPARRGVRRGAVRGGDGGRVPGAGRARPRRRRPARLDHPHLRPRRRRHVRQRHLFQRLRLRGAGAGHRGDPQQHARRGGPQPARLPPHRRPGGGCPR